MLNAAEITSTRLICYDFYGNEPNDLMNGKHTVTHPSSFLRIYCSPLSRNAEAEKVKLAMMIIITTLNNKKKFTFHF